MGSQPEFRRPRGFVQKHFEGCGRRQSDSGTYAVSGKRKKVEKIFPAFWRPAAFGQCDHFQGKEEIGVDDGKSINALVDRKSVV